MVAAVCALAAAVALCGYRIYVVNEEAIRFPTEYYQLGETASLDGCFIDTVEELTDGYAVTVDSVQVLSYNEYIRMYGIDTSGVVEGLDGKSVICLGITISNSAPESKPQGGINALGVGLMLPGSATLFMIDSHLWSQAEENVREGQAGISVLPQSTYSTHIPFTAALLTEHVNDEYAPYLQNVPSGTYELRLSEVPIKKVIQIPISA